LILEDGALELVKLELLF